MSPVRSLLFLLLFSGAVPAFSQTGFSPLKKDNNLETSLLEAINARYAKDVAGLSGQNKKYAADIYKERVDFIRENFTGNDIVTDPKAVSYLAGLTAEIFEANPSLNPTDLRI